MSYNYDIAIKTKEKSKRSYFLVIAMALLLIAMVLEMIYSKYYMLVLLAPFFYLFISYRNLKKHLVHFQKCRLIITFRSDYIDLSINPSCYDWNGEYRIPYEGCKKIEISDTGKADFVLSDFIESSTGKIIKKRTLSFCFIEDNGDDFKRAFQEHVDLYIKNNSIIK